MIELMVSFLRVVLMDLRAAVSRTFLPQRVPRFEILFLLLLNLTLGSIMKNPTEALGELNIEKSPISAISVTAVRKAILETSFSSLM